jgi:cobalamin biosynthesis protein CobT
MAASRKSPHFLSDDKLLAEFDALYDNDTSNSESESQSESEVNESGSEGGAEGEGGAEEICDNFDSDSHQDAGAQHTERRRTARPSFQWQRGNFVPKSMISQIKIQVFRPI